MLFLFLSLSLSLSPSRIIPSLSLNHPLFLLLLSLSLLQAPTASPLQGPLEPAATGGSNKSDPRRGRDRWRSATSSTADFCAVLGGFSAHDLGMVLRNTEVPQGDGGITGPASLPTDQLGSRAGRSRTGNTIFKSGPLFISSKGIGWTSWKKRWFILTRTSLVFFRSDPSALPQRGSELNLTLGGIDLNSSGSVVVRADKKLLTVLFPDGRDGRAFTLKAETSEDMYEWKTALENALAQAPSATLVMGQTGIFRNDATEAIEGSLDQLGHQRPLKSLVVGRPVLLALEDIDGTPSFLEKALRFIEDCGVRAEGILRQSADVEEVKRRVHEYEQGKDEFSPDEDAHLVADCVKHILRELPSSPVPAACCTSLLEAFRSDRASRVDAMRSVISDKFPEPNRRLLLRILKMMRLVVSYKSENRMSTSAVAACMAPLLLRPLLAGDCQFEDDFRMGGDGSLQLLQAAAAANHAQAIVITLLEEYHNIFSDEDEPFTPQLYTDTEGSCSEDDEFTDDDMLEDDRYEDAENGLDLETEDDADCPLSGTCTDCSGSEGSDFENDETSEVPDLTESPKVDKDLEANDNGLKEIEIQDLKDFEVIYLGTETENSFDDNQKLSMEQYTLPQHGSTEQSRSNLQTETDKTYLQIEADKSNLEIEVPTVASPELLEALKDSRSPKVNSHLHHEADKPSLSSAESREFLAKTRSLKISKLKSASLKKSSSISKSIKKSNDISNAKRQAMWGRSSAQKNPSMESIDLSSEDEIEIQHLEVTKADLQKKIAREVEGNFVLQASLERRKEALHERRLALEAEVVRLQEQLQRERDLRSALEAGLGMPVGPLSVLSNIDAKTRAELEEVALAEEDVANLKEKVSDLHEQLNEERQNRHGCVGESCGQHQDVSNNKTAQNLEGENVESLSKDVQPGAVCENVSKEEMPSSTNKPSLKRQQRSSSSTTGSTTDPSAKKQPSALLPTDPPSVECPRSTGPSTDSSTNNLPPQKPDANPSSVYNPKSTGPTAGSSTNKPAPQKQQSSSLGVNSPKSKADCENGMTNDQPSSTNMLAQTSSLNESNPKLKWHPSGSSAEGLVVVLPDTSTQKPTEATTSFPIDELLTATPKSKASGTNSSNGEPLSAAPTGSIKKSAGKVEGLVSSSALSRLTYRFNFKKERRSQSVNELPPTDPLSTSGSETTLPTGTPRTKSR